MTCILGYADEKNMYIAGDACGSNGQYYSKRKDDKVFKKGEMLFGYTTSFRMGHLLQWKFVIPKHRKDISTMEYMNTLFIDEVIKCFSENAYVKVDKEVKAGGHFIVCYDGIVFSIDSDFQVGINEGNLDGCGCGAIAALAAFKMGMLSKRWGIEYNLKKALLISSQMIPGVCEPFTVLRMKIK